MTLEKDEKVILENGITVPTGFMEQQSLTLTNKRLIVYKVLGLFKKTRELDYVIPIDEIAEVYTYTRSGITHHEIKIRLKNNKEHNFELMLDKSDRHTPFTTSSSEYVVIQRAITDRWVNAINNQMKR